jgi:hypothetical protein
MFVADVVEPADMVNLWPKWWYTPFNNTFLGGNFRGTLIYTYSGNRMNRYWLWKANRFCSTFINCLNHGLNATKTKHRMLCPLSELPTADVVTINSLGCNDLFVRNIRACVVNDMHDVTCQEVEHEY